MAVITISRQYGSGGDEIAERVAEILGYTRFDKRLITQAALNAGISEKEAFDYSEDTHKVLSFMDHLFSGSAMVTTGNILDSEGISVYDLELPLEQDIMLALVQKAIRSAYQIGNIVIVGRASQVILQDRPKAVHIRIEAPMEYRVLRLKEKIKQTRQVQQTDGDYLREAQNTILDRDAASADYVRHHYHHDWSDVRLYHAVLNTGKLSYERAAQLIVDLANDV